MWFTLDSWFSSATRPGRPQRVTIETDETPSQIMDEAFRAVVKIALLIVIVALAVFVMVVFGLGDIE